MWHRLRPRGSGFQSRVPRPLQPFQPILFLLVRRDSFHPSSSPRQRSLWVIDTSRGDTSRGDAELRSRAGLRARSHTRAFSSQVRSPHVGRNFRLHVQLAAGRNLGFGRRKRRGPVCILCQINESERPAKESYGIAGMPKTAMNSGSQLLLLTG